MNPIATDTFTVRSSHPGMSETTRTAPDNAAGLDAEPGPVVNLIAADTAGALWDLLVDPRAAVVASQQVTPGTAISLVIATEVPWLHKMSKRSAKTANMW